MQNVAFMNTLLFRDMTPQEIETALRALSARERTFAREEIVLTAGTVSPRLGMVIAGGVTIESNDFWGNRTILSHVGPGQCFAETYALLAHATLPVDVVASEDSRILFFDIAPLLWPTREEEAWARRMIANLLMISAHKNVALSTRSFHTASKHIRGRVMAYLNTLSLQKHAASFDIPFDRQQLADYLNVERTALSKELGKMRTEGIIDFERNHFRILK